MFPQGASQPEDDEIDLGSLIATLWRGKWLISLFMLVAVMIGGYYAYVVATPLYRATAVVILETDQNQIVDLQSVATGLSGDTAEINSEIEVLRSRGLLGMIVETLDLVNDPEFNTALHDPGIVHRFKETLGLIVDENVDPTVEARRAKDRAVNKLIEKTSVANIRNSLVFNITVTSEDPDKAALIADTIVDTYIVNQIEVKFQAMEQATVWLTDRVAELQTSLEEAEANLADFSAATDLISEEALRALERQTKEIRERIEAAEANMAMQSATLAALNAAESRELKAELANDPQLTRFMLRAEDDETMAAAFDARFAFVVQRTQQIVERTEQQLRTLRISAEELEAQTASQAEDLITLQQLTREAEAIGTLYEYFLTRLNETSAQQGIQQADSRVLSDAVVPIGPSEPRKSIVVVLSAILGLIAGAGLVLLREVRNSSFRTADELEAATGYTVLGQLPTMPISKRGEVLSYLQSKPTSVAVEAVRNLRTSLMLSNVDQPPQVIVSTSSVPGDGKTTVAISLAHNLRGLGKKVLLIEGDIRRRTLNEYFGDLPTNGIVSVLAGDVPLDQAIHHSTALDADVLGGEKSSVNAADLFSSDRFEALITELRKHYDAIIIDTPPVLVVPDARIMAQFADAVLFTVRWDVTSKPQLAEAMRVFHTSGQRITGMVLSQISPKGIKRYGYGGKHGAYSAYGSDYYEN